MTRRQRLRFTWATGAVVLAVGGLFLGFWLAPSGDYLLLPDKAQPVAPLVEIDGESGATGRDGSGIYMVDILVRKANLLEKFIPGIVEGSSLVPGEALNPHGVSEQQRQATSSLDMSRSQQIAAAVALEELGYDVAANPDGALVDTVLPDGASAGKLRPGDTIVEANGTPVKTPGDLRDAMAEVAPGDEVAVTVRRKDAEEDFTLTTQASPDDASRAVIGVIVEQAASIELPVEIAIDAGNIGGPSAGLAFALDIVDNLGQDVDQGRRVVATGELELDGSVEPIGGIKQKVIGAERSDADVFVVPEENAEEARKYADGVEILAVDSFDEALAALGADAPPPVPTS